MNIDILKVGYLETNCYILTKNNKSLIIDPGADENFIVSRIKKLNTTPIAILLTHHHEDHTGCVKPLSSMYGIKVYDYNNLFEGNHQIEDFSFEVIYTKGHSATSVTYYFPKEKVMFVGDFIFYENIGRTDLPTGDYKEMIKSIDKIGEYPNDTKIYPGHGRTTTLEHEKKYNEYFLFDKKISINFDIFLIFYHKI